MTMPELRTLQLPEDLCVAVERRYANRFSSVQELLSFVLEELLRHDSSEQDVKEQRMIEQRLKDLGYI